MIKRNQYFKNLPNTKKMIKNITDAPDGDSKIDANDYAADAPNNVDDYAGSTYSRIYPHSLRNHNNYPDAADNDSASPKILNPLNLSYIPNLNAELNPGQWLNLKN